MSDAPLFMTLRIVSVTVLKKAIDLRASGAMALINAIPAPQSLPSNLGQNVNTTA